ncbi:MAG TPA: hydroxymethylglutaryl-CoA lyase, partial [Roseivirga sp.]
NLRGAEQAASFDEINYLGFPLSISETFQQRNTNKSIGEAMTHLSEIQNLCKKTGKTLVTYISMGFGNPYGEEFNSEIVQRFVQDLANFEIEIISLSDTIGVADSQTIKEIFETTITAYPTIEFGAHFHSTPQTTREKIEAALEAGCERFDSAIKGFGGCPMAKDDLTGNVATENLLAILAEHQVSPKYDEQAFNESMIKSLEVFPS